MAGGSNASWIARCWEGLTTATPLSGMVAVGSFAASLAALLMFFSPSRMAETPWYLLPNARDHGLVVTSQLLEWRRHHEPKTRLIIVGSSPTRHALNADIIREELAAYGMEFDEAVNISIGRQTGPQLLAVLDNLPRGGDGVIVFGINPSRFLSDPERDFERLERAPPLGVRSPSYERMGRKLGYSLGRRTGIFLWDNRQFYLPRMRDAVERLWNDEETPTYRVRPFMGKRTHNYRGFRSLGRDYRRTKRLSRKERRQRARTRVGVYRKLAQRARRALGMKVVFYQAPVNPAFDERFGMWKMTRPYWKQMQAMADDIDVPLIAGPELKERDFYDAFHLRSRKAMIQTSKDVARQIGEALD